MPRRQKKLPIYLVPEEAELLIQHATSSQTRLCKRIMWRCGLRVSEALHLRPADIHLRQQPRPMLTVRADSPGNKGRRERLVPIPPDLIALLQDRVADMRGRRYDRILTISPAAVRKSCREASLKSGVPMEKAHPHAFRHGYCRQAVFAGVPLNVLQQWVGHSSLTITEVYLTLAGDHSEWVDRLGG